ncbi:hypothetical protein CC86DRAFT_394454 [Ophiobolus disseminans]|uniref:SprT-like domain-containing protein n=1 Tax=Ophiobolus disseminans TaxID=1469910 RepID=A0A6A6ZZM5_9PLEO|nr:hypothetical protein CC86DRAFT_394454 [Ophiobolus disseminans]
MPLHPITVTATTTRTRRLHPLRRIARLICRTRGQTQQEPHGTEQTCRGSSFLHNFLPILEPFLLFDPKLLFVEDHILGRQQAPHSGTCFKVPSSLDELTRWIEDAIAPCDCDVCSPWLYQLSGNSSHGAINLRSSENLRRPRFYLPNRASHTPRPKLSLRVYGEYEAMRLVRHHVAWLDETYLQTSPSKDNLDVLQLRNLLHAWNAHLTGLDMRQTISKPQWLHLVSFFNKVFFFDAIPPHRQAISEGFSWLPDTEKSCFGIGTYNPIIGTQLLLHPTLFRHHGDPEDADVRWRSRLGTILHEMCHAFLKAYTCRSCPMHDYCVGPRGHGRAWQILASKIEQVATRLIGGFIDMGRYQSLLHDFEGHGRVPSGHDLEVLRFGTRWPDEQAGR